MQLFMQIVLEYPDVESKAIVEAKRVVSFFATSHQLFQRCYIHNSLMALSVSFLSHHPPLFLTLITNIRPQEFLKSSASSTGSVDQVRVQLRVRVWVWVASFTSSIGSVDHQSGSGSEI